MAERTVIPKEVLLSWLAEGGKCQVLGLLYRDKPTRKHKYGRLYRMPGGTCSRKYLEKENFECAEITIDEMHRLDRPKIDEHECESVTTPDGHGAYCRVCGKTLA